MNATNGRTLSVAKELMLKELRAALQSQNYLFFARFQGLSVADFGELRRKLERVANRAIVVKNSITRRVLSELGIDAGTMLVGSILLTTGEKDPQVISKVLVEFAKDRENFQLLGACLDRQLIQVQGIKSLASLPSRQVLLTQVACGLNAPISGFVIVLNQLVQGLVIVLNQIQKRKAG